MANVRFWTGNQFVTVSHEAQIAAAEFAIAWAQGYAVTFRVFPCALRLSVRGKHDTYDVAGVDLSEHVDPVLVLYEMAVEWLKQHPNTLGDG